MGATCIHFGVLDPVSYVIVHAPSLLLLQQLSQVGIVLIHMHLPLFTNPLQLTICLDAVGVKVLVETVVLRWGLPLPPMGFVSVKYNAVILLMW